MWITSFRRFSKPYLYGRNQLVPWSTSSRQRPKSSLTVGAFQPPVEIIHKLSTLSTDHPLRDPPYLVVSGKILSTVGTVNLSSSKIFLNSEKSFEKWSCLHVLNLFKFKSRKFFRKIKKNLIEINTFKCFLLAKILVVHPKFFRNGIRVENERRETQKN